MCPTGQVIIQSVHVLILPAVYISFTGLAEILAGQVKILAGHINFENHVKQMLNVKPWNSESEWPK